MVTCKMILAPAFYFNYALELVTKEEKWIESLIVVSKNVGSLWPRSMQPTAGSY